MLEAQGYDGDEEGGKGKGKARALTDGSPDFFDEVPQEKGKSKMTEEEMKEALSRGRLLGYWEDGSPIIRS